MRTLLLSGVAAVALLGLAYAGNPSATLTVRIVPPTGGPTGGPAVPPPAQASGLTTLAYNADFSSPVYASPSSPGFTNQSNGWLGCLSSGNYMQSHEWWQSNFVNTPCDFRQTTDPDTGETVLDIGWSSSSDANAGRFGEVQIQTGGNGAPGVGPNFPLNSYFEATYRSRTTPTVSGPTFGVPGGTSQWWSGYVDLSGQGRSAYEVDFDEPYWAWTGPTGTIHDWGNGNVGSPVYSIGFGGHDFTIYHTFGTLQEWDGSRLRVTQYIDGVAQGTGQTSNPPADGDATNRTILFLTSGISCTFSPVGSGRDNTCVNAAISNVYNCGGAICITTPSDTDTPGGGAGFTNQSIVIRGATSSSGVLAGILNNQWNPSTKVNSTDWQLSGSSWPGNADSYNSNSGTMNPYTRIDMYVKNVRVWSCAPWATTASQCIGGS